MAQVVQILLVLMTVFNCGWNEKTSEKRILLNDPNILHSEIQALESKLQDLTAKYLDQASTIVDLKASLQSEKSAMSDLTKKYSDQASTIVELKTRMQTQERNFSDLTTKYKTLLSSSKYEGAMFVRWGRRTCPNTTAELVYTGNAGGSWFDDVGGAAEFVCLPPDPDLTTKFSGDYGRMYGAEYDTSDFGFHNGDDLPCSVCRSKSETSVLMIPGKNSCHADWKLQYHGYLVSGQHTYKSPNQYICLDEKPEAVPAGHNDENGKIIGPVRAVCGSLPCPPYQDNTYLTCVVCTK